MERGMLLLLLFCMNRRNFSAHINERFISCKHYTTTDGWNNFQIVSLYAVYSTFLFVLMQWCWCFNLVCAICTKILFYNIYSSSKTGVVNHKRTLLHMKMYQAIFPTCSSFHYCQLLLLFSTTKFLFLFVVAVNFSSVCSNAFFLVLYFVGSLRLDKRALTQHHVLKTHTITHILSI